MAYDLAAPAIEKPAKTYFDDASRKLIYSAADEATIAEAKADIRAACHAFNCRNIAFYALEPSGLRQLACVFQTGGDLPSPLVHGSLRLRGRR